MGRLSNRFLSMMKLSEEEEFEDMIEDEEEVEEEDIEEEEAEETGGFSFFRKKKPKEEAEEDIAPKEVVREQPRRVVTPVEARKPRPVRHPSNIISIERGVSVKVVKPQSFIESKTITDYLKANKVVVVNLEGIEVTTAQRIIDCIGGASYALGGSLDPISNKIFIVAPKGQEVSGDLRDEAVGESFISPDLGSF